MKDRKKNSRFKNMGKAMYMELREHRSSFIVYFVLRFLVIVMMVLQLLNRNYENVFLCVLTLVLLVAPSFVQVTFKVELPTTLEIIILVFIFAAEILGEISEFYLMFPFWDTVLHTLNGFLAAAIGFSLVDLLNRSEKMVFNLSPLFTAIVAFCFSMTIGVLWEFFEFGMDQIIGYDMQKDTVIHTIRSVMLDPAGRNVPYVLDGDQGDCCERQRTRPRRIPGYRADRYDGRPDREFYRRISLLSHRLLLCEEPGKRETGGTVCSPQEKGRPGFPPDRRGRLIGGGRRRSVSRAAAGGKRRRLWRRYTAG